MTNSAPAKNTPAFYAQAAISFGVATTAVIIGIIYLPVGGWIRAFLALGALYLVTSTFTLAKCVRDQQESGSVVNRLDQVRLERLLAEFDPYNVQTPNLAPVGPYAMSTPMPMPESNRQQQPQYNAS